MHKRMILLDLLLRIYNEPEQAQKANKCHLCPLICTEINTNLLNLLDCLFMSPSFIDL